MKQKITISSKLQTCFYISKRELQVSVPESQDPCHSSFMLLRSWKTFGVSPSQRESDLIEYNTRIFNPSISTTFYNFFLCLILNVLEISIFWYYFILIDNKREIYLQPINMTQIEKIFSELVLGDTFPNPTLVKLLKVK